MSSNTPGHNRVTEEKLGFTALDRAVFLVKIFTEKAHYHLKEEKKKKKINQVTIGKNWRSTGISDFIFLPFGCVTSELKNMKIEKVHLCLYLAL